MFGEVVARPHAGGDGNSARAKGFAARDVARRIADDVGFFRQKFAAMLLFCARPRKTAELVAIMMIVRERAEFKKVPDAVMLELELGAARDIAGQKRENEMSSRFQFLEQLEHAGEELAFSSWQL